MIKKIFLLVLCFSFNISVSYSQNDSFDDILDSEVSNIEKINALIALIRNTVNNAPDSIDDYVEELRKLSKIENHTEGIIAADLFMGIKYSRLGKFDVSNEYLLKTMEEEDKMPSLDMITESYMIAGINYVRMGITDKAAEQLQQCIEKGNQFGHYDLVASAFVTLGILNSNIEQPDKALEYFLRAEKIAIDNQLINIMGSIYSNLANIYQERGDNETQLLYIDKQIEHSTANNNLYSLSIAYHNKAAYYYDQDNTEETIINLIKSIEIKEQINDQNGVAVSKIGLAEIYYKNGQYSEALQNVLPAILTLEESNESVKLMNAYSVTSNIYKSMGDYERAYDYLVKYIEVKDKVFNENREKTLAELNAKYELAEKDKENQILQNKSDRQKFIIVIVIIAITAVSILLIFVILKNRAISNLNKKLEINRKHIEEQNEELDMLNKDLLKINHELHETNAMKDKFFSILAHDLMNPLSGLHGVIDLLLLDFRKSTEGEKLHLLDLLKESSLNTYNLLENLLTWSRTQMGKIKFHKSIFELNGLVENVFGIVKASFSFKDIEYINEVKPEIEVEGDLNMLSTIIRNIVTNAVKFTHNGGKVTVFANKNGDNHTFITISDTGVGMTQEQIDGLFQVGKTRSTKGTNQEKGTGLGLIIAKEFIDKHNGSINVESTQGVGSRFIIKI